MAGIYFHIPFCKKKCNYCDFYSKRDSREIVDVVGYEVKELVLKKDYLDKDLIETIYFGGGTPSLLEEHDISRLLESVRQYFNVSSGCEITFESNPDDLSEVYLNILFNCGINRLSIGIQSFNDEVLKFLGRRHDSKKLNSIIDCAKKIGFSNISVDVIFGIPGMALSTYTDTLNKIIQLNIQHISAYSLTIAEGTVFYKMLKNNKLNEINEEDLLIQFNTTIDTLSEKGYIQYEISNYAKEGFKSRHNISYWNNVKYLGIGPGAHSFNNISRQWNISDTGKYCNNIDLQKLFYEIEYLTDNDKFNEYLITGLRTSEGVSLRYINSSFNEKVNEHFLMNIDKLMKDDLVYRRDEDRIILTRRGLFISDYILRMLYYM